jgi:uncharacterized protein (TIGR03382 family)
VAVYVAAFAFGAPALASIDISLQPSLPQYSVGNQVAVGVYAFADPDEVQGMLSFQMIFTWDPSRLHLNGVSTLGGQPFTAIGFIHDAYGINETNPPTDGNAMLIGLGPLGSSIVVPQQGVLLTTLLFDALAPASGTPLTILPSAGSPVGTTVVYGDTGPNVSVTGTTTGTSITIIPAPCSAVLLAAGASILGRRRRDAATR